MGQKNYVVEARALDRLSIGLAEFTTAGRLQFANQATLDLWGASFAELEARPAADWVPGWNSPSGQRVRQFIPSLEKWLETRLVANEQGVTALFEEVDQNVQLATVVAGAPDFIGVFDPSLKFSYINPAGLKLLGRRPGQEPNEIILSDIYPAWALHRVMLGIQQVALLGQWEGETAVLGAHGEEIPLSQIIQSIYADDGTLLGYSTIARNVAQSQRREKLLRESESRFRRAVVEAPIPVLIVAEDGELLAISDFLCQLTGYQHSEFDRLSHWLLVAHREEAESVREYITAVLQQQLSRDFETSVYTRTGEKLFWRFTGSTVGNLEDGRRYAVIMALDLTDRLEKERALQEGQDFLRRTLDALNLFAGVCTPDGKLVQVSRVALEAAHLTPEQVLGMPFEDTWWWADRPQVQVELRKAIQRAAAGKASHYDVEIKVADGRLVTLDFQIVPMRDPDGRVTHLVLSGRDISERKRIEQEMEAGRERFRALLDSTAEGIFGLDLSGKFIFANTSCIAMLGYSSDREMLGRNARDLLYADGEEPVVLQALQKEQPIHLPETRLGRRDGEAFPVECWAHPTRINGVMVGCVVTFLDITQRLESERELSRAKSQAEAASLAKSEFLANVSHEIRTPMAAILGYVDILLRQMDDPEKVAMLQIIQRNGGHLLEIINDILDLSKIEAGSFQVETVPVSVLSLVSEVVSLMEVRAKEKELELRLEFQTQVPETISSDPTRLRQILMNLLGNAIKFTNQGWVSLSVSLNPERQRLDFCVQDTGIGIAPARLEHLFEPFSQADTSVTRRFGGTGLGLAISRTLVRMLGGDLEVSSQEGVGSTLRFSVATGSLTHVSLLDSSRWADAPRPVPPVTEDLPRLDGQRVLLVDDRRDLRQLVQSYLEEVGAEVVTADDGQVALDFMVEGEADVMVLDMQMPRLDGYATARELRKRGRDIPILAITASAMKGDRETCLQAGCTSYLTKPVDRVALIHQVACLSRRGDCLRVLVVEDNPLAAQAVKGMLNTIGFEVDLAHDGGKALQFVETQAAPDYVLIDLGLPDMDGWELLGRLRSQPSLKETRFIAHTGKDPRQVLLGSAELHFDAVMQKPVSRDVLLKTLFA